MGPMVPSLVLAYGNQLHQVSAAGNGSLAVQMVRNLESCSSEAQKHFNLPAGTFELVDRFGKIEYPEDLQRALQTAGSSECTIEVREHLQFIKLRDLEEENTSQNSRMDRIEALIQANKQTADANLEESENDLRKYIELVERKILDEIIPTVEELCRDRTQMQKDIRKAQEKLRQINVRELHEMKVDFEKLQEEVRANIRRVDRIDTMWTADRARLEADISRGQGDLRDLQQYIQGKMDVLVGADADLAKHHQVLEQRVRLMGDDIKLLTEDQKEVTKHATTSVERVEEIHRWVDDVKSFNERLHVDAGHFRTRFQSLELAAMERWTGFFPGVLYFKHWHRTAKGPDVDHSRDRSVAVGRGNTASTGILAMSDEGLTVADGPCRRFGDKGHWASYFEFELDEMAHAPDGVGGLFAGFSIQSAEEIAAHPHHEFDGWLLGGTVKALICRAGLGGLDPPDLLDYTKLPATWAPGADATETAHESVKENVDLLRLSFPPQPNGVYREVPSSWKSEDLAIGDVVGILFRCKAQGGAKMRVQVNGAIVATHEFTDAPPADAVGFVTPIVRIAGTGKAVRLFPDRWPSPDMLAN